MTFDQITTQLSSQAYKDAMGDIKHLKFFPAIYETQRDNKLAPSSTCAITCMSMLLQTYKIVGSHREMESDLISNIEKEFSFSPGTIQ